MVNTGVKTFDKTVIKTKEWLHTLEEMYPSLDDQGAYFLARAVLHTLRDTLNPEQNAHLSSQFPLLLKGIYYEDYHVRRKPFCFKKKEFYTLVRERFNKGIDAEHATKAVFYMLSLHISRGEFEHVRVEVPPDLREFFTSDFLPELKLGPPRKII